MLTHLFGLVFVAVLVSVTACKGEAGPAGADGMDGEDGAPGADGLDGANGVNGVNGKDGAPGRDGADGNGPITSVFCAGSVTRNSGADLVYTLHYAIVEYANGDAFVTCSLADGFGTSSDAAYYAADQMGATTLGCYVTADEENGTFGFWRFALEGGVYQAEYSDADSTNDAFVFTFDGPDASRGGCDMHDLQ